MSSFLRIELSWYNSLHTHESQLPLTALEWHSGITTSDNRESTELSGLFSWLRVCISTCMYFSCAYPLCISTTGSYTCLKHDMFVFYCVCTHGKAKTSKRNRTARYHTRYHTMGPMQQDAVQGKATQGKAM